MPLSPSALLALAALCAPDVAPPTLLAIARVESGLEPYAIGINGAGVRGLRPATAQDAARTARKLIASGHDLDLGLAQINARNLAWLGLSVESAFDPCANLAASARVLADGYRRANPRAGREQQGLRTALSFYNTGSAERGFRNGYVARVVAAAGLDTVSGPPQPPAALLQGREIAAQASFVIHPKPGGRP